MKILVTGSPDSGKTTFVSDLAELGVRPSVIFHTDSLLPMHWSEHSDVIAKMLRYDGVMEGVVIPRALRKWLAANPEGKPCDVLIWLQPVRELKSGQLAMAKGMLTVLKEILPELYKRGVRVIWEAPPSFLEEV